ncbi:MAG: Ig-like domain-containing protein, partial [Planctomycetota bacterium]
MTTATDPRSPHTPTARLTAAARPVIEGLEGRRLLSVTPNEAPTLGGVSFGVNDTFEVGRDVGASAIDIFDVDGEVETVEFFLDGQSLGSVEEDPRRGTFSISISTFGFEVGSYTVSAVATDDDGATSASVSNVFTLVSPNQPPTIGELVDSPDPLTTEGGITLTAVDAEDVDGLVVQVNFFLGSSVIGSDTDGSDGWSFFVDDFLRVPGETTYRAQAFDDDGAESEIVSTVNTYIRPDPNAPPVIAETGLTLLTASVGETLSLVAEGVRDLDGEVVRVDYFRLDETESTVVETLLGSAVPVNERTSFDITVPDSDVSRYLARPVDDDGAVGDGVVYVVETTDGAPNQPPIVNGVSINPNPIFVDGSTTFTATGVQDADGTVTGVEFFVDGVSVGTDTDPAGGYSIEFVANNDFLPGDYTVTATATDDDGATTTVANTLTIIQPDVDQPPMIGSLNASPNPVFAGESLTLTAIDVTDDDGVSQVEFFLVDPGSGIPLARGIDTDGSDGWSVTFPADPAEAGSGRLTYEAFARDTIGQKGNTVSVSVDVLTSGNVAPVVGDVRALPEPVVQGDGLSIGVFDVFDADGNLSSVLLLRDGVVIDSENAVPGAPNDLFDFSVDTSDLAPGVYAYSVIAVDSEGLESDPRFVNSTVISPPPPPP